MSTQIENVVTSFKEVLLQTSSVFDDLYKDKSRSLVVPNQQRPSQRLNDAIANFNSALDSVVIQLNDVALFKLKLEQQAVQREEKKKEVITKKEEPVDDSFNGESNNILDDINDFLSTVPDNGDMAMPNDFNDNIQQLLMENGGDYDNNINMAELGIDNDFTQNGDMNFDENIFDEIDSMLNI